MTPLHVLDRIRIKESAAAGKLRTKADTADVLASQLRERSERLASLSKRVHDLRRRHNR
jgi:hypothetical protein